ncbi:MAG: pyruvate formate lyase activating enzyme [Candidatus Binatia bacterium]|jgi:pyruvate formate lyase activating enzyme
MTTRPLLAPGVVRGEWWSRLDNGKVQCDLCPRHCRLSPGQRGFCFVREERDGGMALTSYGRASGFCIDPIEKKPLNHFYPGTPVLSFGTAGCNLGCKFCQNWDISKARENDRLQDWASPEAVAEAAVKHNCRSIAFTYNDPVIFAEYAIDCARAAHERGVKTVAVSAGYITSQARGDFYEHIDAANIDLKAFTQQFYKKLCFADLAPILDTLKWLKHETEVWIEVTTLLIPGQNDSVEEVQRLSDWFIENLGPETPLHFTAFHPDFKMTDLPRTPSTTLLRAREIARNAGLKHVYTGNVHDVQSQSTYCAGCGELLIERDWYQLGQWSLTPNGNCRFCNESLVGHFETQPGTWGAKRERIAV